VNGEYRTLLVDEPNHRPSEERIAKIMKRFDYVEVD